MYIYIYMCIYIYIYIYIYICIYIHIYIDEACLSFGESRKCARASVRPRFPQQVLLGIRHALSTERALARKVRLNQNSYRYIPTSLTMC